MVRILYLLTLTVLTFSCSKSDKSGGDSVSTTANGDSIAPAEVLGKTYYYAVQNPNGDKYVLAIQMGTDKSVKNMAISWTASGGTVYRKNTGTYVRSADTYTFTYNYETCNPTGSEKFIISSPSNGKLTISPDGSSTELTFQDEQIYPFTDFNINSTQSMVEDVNCNLISSNDLKKAKANIHALIKSGSVRKPASVK